MTGRVEALGVRGRKTLAALLMMSASLGVMTMPMTGIAAAQSADQVSFSVPAGPLQDALAAFGRQAGLQVTYLADITAGRTSPGVSGAATPEAALGQLLSGTGLSYRFTNAKTVAITDPSAVEADGAIVLDPVKVESAGTGRLPGAGWEASPDHIYETPASVAEISAAEIASRGHDLNNAMRSVAGVYTWENVAQPGMAVNIRGLEGFGRVTSTIDGVRQNYRFTGHGPAGYTYVDPSLLAGIDITKGAVTTVGGAGTLAGAVNYRTLSIDDVLGPDEKAAARITATFGGNAGDDMSLTVAGGMRFDIADEASAGGIFGAVNLTSASAYENGDGETVTSSWRDVKSGLIKLSLAPNASHRLELGAVFYTTDFDANFYNQNVANTTVTAKYAYTPGGDMIDLRMNASYNLTESTWIGNLAYNGRVITTEALAFDISNTSRWVFGDYGLKLDYGIEFYRDDFSGNTTLDANPDGIASVGGAFVQATFVAGIFEFIPGLRYDAYSMDSAGTTGNIPATYWTIRDNLLNTSRVSLTRPSNSIINNTTRYTVAELPFTDPPWRGDFDIDQTDYRLSPRVTLAARVLDWLQVYGTYERSFRPPTVNEMFFGGSHGSGVNAAFVPNPGLVPEYADGWEFGINVLKNGVLDDDDALRLKAAWYEKDIENFIIARCFGTGSMCWFENVPGESRLNGYEVDASYDVGWAFAAAAYSRATSNLTFGSGIGGMGQPSRLPDDYATLTAGVRLFDQALTIGARMNDISKGTLIENGGWETAAYTTYDLFAAYQPSARLNLFVNVTNLTDVQYMPAMSQDDGPGQRIFGGITIKLGEGPLLNFAGGTGEAPAIDWTGFHIGVGAGYSWAEAATDQIMAPIPSSPAIGFTIRKDTRGYSGRVIGGYDYQFESGLVLGVSAAYDAGDIEASETVVWSGAFIGANDRRQFVTVDSQVEWTASLSGKIGYALGGYLPYVTAGLALADYSHAFTFVNGPQLLAAPPPPVNYSGERYTGWTVGAGVERAVSEHVTLRAEYNYADYGDGRALTWLHAPPAAASPFNVEGEYRVLLKQHDIKIGVSYRF